MHVASPAKPFDASLCVPVSFVYDIGIYAAELQYYLGENENHVVRGRTSKMLRENGKRAFEFFILLIRGGGRRQATPRFF